MKNEPKFPKRYYIRVAAALPCAGKEKRAVMTELKKSVSDYLAENENADEKDVYAVFGTPREIADAARTASTSIKQTGILLRAAVIVLFAALLIWAVFAAVCAIDVHVEAHGYFGEYIAAVPSFIAGWCGLC